MQAKEEQQKQVVKHGNEAVEAVKTTNRAAETVKANKKAGDATEFKNDYENPNAGAIDGVGQPKPAFYGVDPNGNSLNNPQEEE